MRAVTCNYYYFLKTEIMLIQSLLKESNHMKGSKIFNFFFIPVSLQQPGFHKIKLRLRSTSFPKRPTASLPLPLATQLLSPKLLHALVVF